MLASIHIEVTFDAEFASTPAPSALPRRNDTPRSRQPPLPLRDAAEVETATGWLSKPQFGRLLAAIMDLQRRGRGAQPPNKTGSLGAHGSKSSAKIDHIQVNKMGIVTVVKCPEVAVILIQTQ